jgi:methionyl-tRNA formyltransferase
VPNIVIAADGDVGLEILRYLEQFFYQDVAMCVVVPGSNVESLALSFGFRVVPWIEEIDVADQMRTVDADFGILAWWPYILHNPLLSIPKQGWINTHPSLLPYGRGKHNNFWTIVDEVPFGVSLHWASEEIDSGDLIAQQEIQYDWTDTGGSLYLKATTEMPGVFKDNYELIRDGMAPRLVQDLNSGSFHQSNEMKRASQLDLDSSMTVRSLLNLLRARNFEGFPACTFTDLGRQYEVRISIAEVD